MAAAAFDPEQCEEFISKGEPCDPGLRHPPQGWRRPAAAVGAALLGLLACSAALAVSRGHVSEGSAEPALQLEELRQHGPEAAHEYVIPARALESRACDRLLARLDDLNGQDLDTTAEDPEFPPAIGSIGDPGQDCSDSAQGGAPTDCEEEDHWSNFQDVAERMGKPFQVLDKPDFSDIEQGYLGDCYFMAAMASIAHARPKVIERMFVEREKWADLVYTTRWLLNGRVVRVRVDNMVPATGRRRSAPYQRRRSNGHPTYAKPSSDGEWWPVILEKAWAKMYGSYHATQGGKWANAVQAITMAPVIGYDHEDLGVDKVLELVESATAKNFPMGGSVSPKGESKYGLKQHHSYAVLGARVTRITMALLPFKTRTSAR